MREQGAETGIAPSVPEPGHGREPGIDITDGCVSLLLVIVLRTTYEPQQPVEAGFLEAEKTHTPPPD